ncbi:DUF4159 domain-containing protein [Actibacterium sp. XHP0104]|uniref:DUF4159 domain-containing protein n=1 Tax=Actibacterium sp. XHP0104 TaxID=2984335 RepID=UPI0021E70687|nr:DUF4159 domain-containing protein [Actibacterium sp. XHP0104]MCV2882322.1 DUF4159 domain-containing protein [Actibacterium sp. XHP0104]
MFTLGPIGFTTPALLLALLALPVLWLLLRAVPPAPIRRRFPGVALLLGLTDDEHQTDKTPWWLLLLRMLAVAAAIIAFAGPVLNPREARPGTGPLLILADGTWADARDWPRRLDQIAALLTEAGRDGRPVALALASAPPTGPVQFQGAEAARTGLPGLAPNPWEPNTEIVAWAEAQEGPFDTYWLSDDVDRDSRADLLAALERQGQVRVFQSPRPVYALRPAQIIDGALTLQALRAETGTPAAPEVAVIGTDPNGIERELARAPASFGATDTQVDLAFDLPPELRNRVRRFEIVGERSAAAVSLTDDGLKRREVALVSDRDSTEAQDLLSPLHYLRQALTPSADLIEGALTDLIPANPDVLVLADIATLSQLEEKQLLEWVANGGMLLRFAGPRLAASDISRVTEDPLMPVRLRAGGRMVGGAMSWGEPKTLRPFADTSPFAGLAVPDEVRVSAQVMAQPDPALAERTIAALADGTPLVTRKSLGAGQVVLFHVTASADWSSLPLSVLFVEMLDRLAITSGRVDPGAADLAGQIWVPEQVMDGFGQIADAGAMPGVAGEDLARGPRSATQPPGLYAGSERRVAMNVFDADRPLAAASWPSRIAVEGLSSAVETLLKGPLLMLALILLLVDILAALWLTGRLRGPRAGVAALVLAGMIVPQDAPAQTTDDLALSATTEVVLAYVITGDARLDEMARAGLVGLSQELTRRTAIEPAPPIAVNLETDELAFFPLLYWPVNADQPLPSAEAYVRLNRYLRTGGMILFDTRDAGLGPAANSSAEARHLQFLARPLDIPPLEPIPHDHVLTRSFYLLQEFPGRHNGPEVWVEAAPPDAEQAEGMPFRNLNDGVTPVVIGGNDWAAAWAVGSDRAPIYPVGRGFTGEKQREMAYRFGINLVMHVLTGNYKSDQVHVPALLERLGQ